MDDFIKMDVFFFVSTAAVVVLTALASMALIRVNRILRTLEALAHTASDEASKWLHTVVLVRKAAERLVRPHRKQNTDNHK